MILRGDDDLSDSGTYLGKEMMNLREKMMMTKEQMDDKLKTTRIKARIYRILTWCAIAAAILTVVITKNLLIALLFLIIALVFGIPAGRAIRRRDKLRVLLGDNVINDAIRDVLGDDVEYNPSSALKPGSVVVPFSYDYSGGAHHIKAVYNGMNIELGTIMLQKDCLLADDGGNTYHDACVHFRGPWIICDFGKKPACSVYISEWTQKDRKSMESNVKIDNEQFGSRFCVRADDPQEAYKVLTPQMMEAISAAADKSGGMIYMSFLPDGKVHVGIQTGHNLFEVGKYYDLDVGKWYDAEGLRQKFSEVLRRLTDIIDTLNV